MWSLRILTCVFAATCFAGIVRAADIDPLPQQRADFKLAWDAATRGDMPKLAPYLETLKGYPLYPYLRYAYLEATLDRAPDALVEQFLAENQDLPMDDDLRRDWLVALAKRQEWSKVLAYYRDESSLPLRCASVSAHLLKEDEPDHGAWTDDAQRLWLTPGVPLDVCQTLFDYMDAKDLITTDMRRKRVQAALNSRDFITAAALAPGLPADDRAWAQRWVQMAADPAHELKDIQVPDEPRYQEMLQSGVRLLARTSPVAAEHLWNDLTKRYRFSHDDLRDMRTLLAMQHVWHLTPDARAQIKDVHDAIDPNVPEWRARLALRAGDWKEALKDINGLGDAGDTEWRYWRARALEALGRKTEARTIYRELARSPDYYGFLSADRLNLDYRIVQETSKPAKEVIAQLESRAGFVRARELVYAGLYPLADAEWAAATRSLSGPARCQAALLAERWGWHARVIPAMATGGCWQDLSLIYPIAFEYTLAPQAQRLDIDLSWVYGVIRQESVFKPNAVSYVGALGLMQLMPSTGLSVGARIGLALDDPEDLLDPKTNLRVGSAYLGSLLQHFDGSEAMATAAYNAGENRVDDWRPESGALPADVWIDTIPYSETRNYVRRVMAHSVLFDWRLNGKPRRLSDRIGMVEAAGLKTSQAEKRSSDAEPVVAVRKRD
jgi:soluble lytic murein transglycosylase